MRRHTTAELRQMQSLPLDAKIAMTKLRIREWYNNYDGQVYVSFSGGKDSTVLKHIVDSMYSDVPAVFVNTGLEYPEIQHFVREVKAGKWDCFNSDVEILRPDMRFDEVVKKYGYPVISKEVSQSLYEVSRSALLHNIPKRETRPYFRKFSKNGPYASKKSTFSFAKYDFLLDAPFGVSHMCCRVMKKKPAHSYEKSTGRKPFIGTTADESRLRMSQWMQRGCNAFEAKRPTSQPLSFWTEQDVLNYIKSFDVPYCSVYGEIKEDDKGRLITTGANRTGCMFCMFGVHLEKEPNRFQRMQISHPKQYAYCMDKLGLREVLEYVGVPYECKKEK